MYILWTDHVVSKLKHSNIGDKMPKNIKNAELDILDTLEDLEDDDYESYNEYLPEEMISVMSSILAQSIDIAKLVIENRARNSEKMSDQDIYQIHLDSYAHINNILSKD